VSLDHVPESGQNSFCTVRLIEAGLVKPGTQDVHYQVHADPDPVALIQHLAKLRRKDGVSFRFEESGTGLIVVRTVHDEIFFSDIVSLILIAFDQSRSPS
jgi:hypothetical protein